MTDPTGLHYWLPLAVAALLVAAGCLTVSFGYRRGVAERSYRRRVASGGALHVAAAVAFMFAGEWYLAVVWLLIGVGNMTGVTGRLIRRWSQ